MSDSISILDQDLSELKDLPAFEVPYSGVYSALVSTSIKNINNKDCVEASFVIIECHEKENQADPDTAPGTTFSTLFMLDNEWGVGGLKKFLAPFSTHFGTSNVRDLVTEVVKDVTVVVPVKRKADKKDPSVFRANIGTCAIV